MNTKEYDQKKQECWEEYFKHVVCGTDSHEYWFNKIFDCAFALGKEKEPITQEEIKKASVEFADREYEIGQVDWDALYKGYSHGMKDSLGKQEKDAEGEEMLTVPRSKVQEMFGEARKYVPTCEHDRGFRNAELTILRNLFGSKCLPDDGDKLSPEPTQDLNPPKSTPLESNCTKESCSSDHSVVKDEMIDSIIKEGFRKHNRLYIAAMAMQGILSNQQLLKNAIEIYQEETGSPDMYVAVAKSAKAQADALIAEVEKGGEE